MPVKSKTGVQVCVWGEGVGAQVCTCVWAGAGVPEPGIRGVVVVALRREWVRSGRVFCGRSETSSLN